MFIETFFAYILHNGHNRIPYSSEEDARGILDVYDAEMMDLRNQVCRSVHSPCIL